MEEHGCQVAAQDCYLEPYAETRSETVRRELSTGQPPEALFTRFDFQAADESYTKPPHVDWPRRLIGGVLFCCDEDEEGLVGGRFALHLDDDYRNDRRSRRPRIVKEFPIRHNSGVLFLNSNRAFHGPTRIRKARGLRKWIYYSISSQRSVWPSEFEPTPLDRAKRAVRIGWASLFDA
jgi:hypothetical protein